MTESEVKSKWPSLHKVIKCADMGALQMCQPGDPVPLDPVKLLRYEAAETAAFHPAPALAATATATQQAHIGARINWSKTHVLVAGIIMSAIGMIAFAL